MVDVDKLPPTQYLILEVLAARHRLGEQLWPFPSRNRPALNRLAHHGLLGWRSGPVQGWVQAWLTDEGRAAVLHPPSATPAVGVVDAAHIARQRAFSERTFGPGPRTAGVLDHIRKELAEIEQDPADLGEWVDVVILALDGAWRAGHEPQEIVDAIVSKQAVNEARAWPDWRAAPRDKAIEHDRA